MENVSSTVLLSLLRIEVANMLLMHNSKEIIVQLPYLQDQKLLTLHWSSFPECGIDCVACSFAYKGCHYIGYA